MANITWQDVSDAAVELAGLPAAFTIMILAFVNGGTGLDVNNYDGEGGPKTFAARVFLAAHFGTMLLRKGVGGAITHQSEGGASQAYLIHWKNPAILDTTSYGQMLHAMTLGTPARAGFLAGGGFTGPGSGWGW